MSVRCFLCAHWCEKKERNDRERSLTVDFCVPLFPPTNARCLSYDCLWRGGALGTTIMVCCDRTYEMWMVEPMIVGLICGFLWLRFGFDDSTWSHEWLLIVGTCWSLFGVSCVHWCEKKERNDREITNRWLLCPFFRPLMRDVLCVIWLFAHSIIRWRGGAWAQHELESWFVAIWSDVWNVDGWTDDCRIDLWFLTAHPWVTAFACVFTHVP